MFIVLDKPSPNGELAVNTDAYEIFYIRKIQDKKFQLAVKKFYDAYQSDKSALAFGITDFDTYEKCTELFKAIIKAKGAGATVFDLSAYLKKLDPVSDALKSDDDMPSA